MSKENDLISREALREKLKERCYNDGLNIETVIELIDNAPPVEPEITTKQAIAKIQETGLLSAHDKMMKEWVEIKCACCNKNAQQS